MSTTFTSTDYSNAGSPAVFTIPSSFTTIADDANVVLIIYNTIIYIKVNIYLILK